MLTIEQKLHDQIEAEGLWLATEQGNYFFCSMFLVTTVLVYGLWDIASHTLLLAWLSIITVLNFFRWLILRFYHTHKNELIANVVQFKRVILLVSILAGLCWAICVSWFLTPSQPINVLTISIPLIITVVGAMLVWFCYVPAVIAISFPPALSLVILLFFQGDKTYIATSILLFLLTGFGVISCRKLSGMLNHALRLNFENAALRQESEEKSRLLEIALAEAEQANAAKTRFLAAASHDLRQPIHALGLFFAELSDRVHGPDTALVISQVEDSISAINSMLNALLDVSKLDAGVVTPTIGSFALTRLFARLEVEFQPIAAENHNELRISPTLAAVKTDATMLERMLRNLIGNALRYTKNGRVLVAARPYGQNLKIRVLDNGPGIPHDQLNDIFIEFVQLQNPARDRRQGLGLGLAIVKRLASLLRHKVKVVSRVGRGSCFSIILPVAKATTENKPRQLEEKTHRPNYSLAGLHVLVLDDDIAVLEGMEGLLNHWGCQVIAVGSFAKALIKLAETSQKLDLLIIDYRLPEQVSGIDVATELQSRLDYPVTVLIITGDTGPERLREANASGYPLLHKPVQPAKLRSTLQYLMTK